MIKKILDYLYFRYEILSTRISFFASMYIKFHESSVKKEIKMADLSSSDKIIHIGCGAIPYTSIILSEETNAKIVGIDYQKKVVDHAKKFVKKLGLENKITIKKQPGESMDISKFNVVFLSYGIEKPNMVFNAVKSKAKPNTKIIFRRSVTGENEYLNEVINEKSVTKLRSLLTQESIFFIKK